MIPALTLTNIVFTYPGTSEPLLDGIDVTFARGWTAVLGDNGIGKTTLAKLAIGRLSPDAGRISPTPNRLHTGYCPQNTDETPENLETSPATGHRKPWRYAVNWASATTGLGGPALSGGEAKRLQIACALATDPDVLVLDEPTNHLDIPSVEWLEDFLKNYNGSYIVISHDRYFLDAVTNRTFEIENTRLTEYKGNYTKYLQLKEENRLAMQRVLR